MSTETAGTAAAEYIDPRVRRTRGMLEQSLQDLLHAKPFESISVGDIAAAATLNRATFYAHYPDKTALLESLVATRFQALIERRGVVFNGGCPAAIERIVLAVCDYLLDMSGCPSQRPMDQHLEVAMVAVVRKLILDGSQRHPPPVNYTAEMIAGTMANAIFGAAKEWLRSSGRPSPAAASVSITNLIAPILHAQLQP